MMLIFEVICKKKGKLKNISITASLEKYNTLIMIIIVIISTIIAPLNSISLYLCAGLILKMHKNKTLNRKKQYSSNIERCNINDVSRQKP
jgi:hypothetical protein